jgi:hypothetical protein
LNAENDSSQLHGPAGLKGWASAASGIKVFMEGFRVVPYGEARNDWLSFDLDHTGRSWKFSWLKSVYRFLGAATVACVTMLRYELKSLDKYEK